MKVLVTQGNDYRIREPYSNLKVEGIEFVIWTPDTSIEQKFDVIVMHQPVVIDMPQLKQFQSDGGKVIVDCDDDLLSLPYSNPVFEEMKRKNGLPVFKECLRLCDYIHVSTPQLKKALLHPGKTEVFLNGINFDNYHLDEKDSIRREFRAKHKVPDNHKIIGWQGSPSHVDSLALIRPAMKELLQRGNITFAIACNIDMLNVLGLTNQKNIICIGWQQRERALEFPAIADVFLCPLPDNKFSQSKSEIKILEAAVWKVQVVASAVAPFIRFHEKSEGGIFLVRKERIKHWVDAIDKAMESPELAEKSYICAKEQYDLKVLNEKRRDWWKSL